MLVEYLFVIRSGDTIEVLGTITLKDDDEARLFAAGVIHDLMEKGPTCYAASMMDITQGGRAVACVHFGPEGVGTS
jgi:hypothetical protein